MADDLGVQFFTAAKAQHESAAKWHLIVLAVLLYFHLALAAPFARQAEELAAVTRERDQQRLVEDQLAPILESAAAFNNFVQSEVGTASSSLKDELVAGFTTLSEKLGRLVELGPEKAAGAEGERVFQASFGVADQVQPMPWQQDQQRPNLAAPSLMIPAGLAPMDPELRGRVAEAGDRPDPDPRYLDELERYIDDAIIAPAFRRANDAWASGHSPGIADRAEQLDAQLESAVEVASAASDQLTNLRKSVAALRDASQGLTFAPPQGSGWWRTVAGKEASIRGMVGAMMQSSGDITRQQDALQTAKDKASAAIAESERRAEEVTKRQAELEEQAKALEAQLGAIGEPLKVISVRLSLLVPLLPLVIGIGMAALALWRAESLRRMSVAAALVEDPSQKHVIRHWLQAAASGSAPLLAAWQVAAGTVAAVWVLMAWQSSRLLPAAPLSSGGIAAAALAVIVAAWLYHWYRAQQALTLSLRP
jgi:hypothetical protein